MVVLSACVLSKSGQTLVARQFVALKKYRVESLLSEFASLVDDDNTGGYFESDSARYVFSTMGELRVLLITNRQSNILEDLSTLSLVEKLVPEYCGGRSTTGITASDVTSNAFSLIFALDELFSLGYREDVSAQQIKLFHEMNSHEENLEKIVMEAKMDDAREKAREKAWELEHRKSKEYSAQTNSISSDSYGSVGSGSSSFGSDSLTSSSRPQPLQQSAPLMDAPDRSKYDGGNIFSQKQELKNSRRSRRVRGALSLGSKKKQKDSSGDGTEDLVKQLSREEKFTGQARKPQQTSGSTQSTAPVEPSGSSENKKQAVSVLLEEEVTVSMEREGDIKSLDVKGGLRVCVFDPDESKLALDMAVSSTSGAKLRLHPRMDMKAWKESNRLQLARADKPFPMGARDAPTVLKWKYSSSDDDEMPLNVAVWNDREQGKMAVQVVINHNETGSISNALLQNVTLVMQLPGRAEITGKPESSQVQQGGGELTWTVGEVGPGSNLVLEYTLAQCEDVDELFPVKASFDSDALYAGLDVSTVHNLETNSEAQRVGVVPTLRGTIVIE